MNTYHHELGEGLSKMTVSFADSYVVHSYDMYIHPNFSIETVKQILEDALLNAIRKENNKL